MLCILLVLVFLLLYVDLQYEAKAGEAVVLQLRPSSPPIASVTLHLQSANLAETAPVEIGDGVTCQPKGKFSQKDGERGQSIYLPTNLLHNFFK